jgi:threonylcarbamoyladenosine tRNA methylthiotransferase MtaB
MAPAYLHVFPFSPRPGTPAASFKPRTPEKIARQRVEELRKLSGELKTRFYERFLGRALTAVLEQISGKRAPVLNARTDNYILVSVNGMPLFPTARSFPVRLETMTDGEVFGKIIPWSDLSSFESAPEL